MWLRLEILARFYSVLPSNYHFSSLNISNTLIDPQVNPLLCWYYPFMETNSFCWRTFPEICLAWCCVSPVVLFFSSHQFCPLFAPVKGTSSFAYKLRHTPNLAIFLNVFIPFWWGERGEGGNLITETLIGQACFLFQPYNFGSIVSFPSSSRIPVINILPLYQPWRRRKTDINILQGIIKIRSMVKKPDEEKFESDLYYIFSSAS